MHAPFHSPHAPQINLALSEQLAHPLADGRSIAATRWGMPAQESIRARAGSGRLGGARDAAREQSAADAEQQLWERAGRHAAIMRGPARVTRSGCGAKRSGRRVVIRSVEHAIGARVKLRELCT